MIAAALATAAAFNLICTGTEMDGRIPARVADAGKGVPFSVVYRVDLQRSRYCSEACRAIERIDSVSNVTIDFRVPRFGPGPPGRETIFYRRTGVYSDSFTLRGRSLMRIGRCRRAAFTGFPSMLGN